MANGVSVSAEIDIYIFVGSSPILPHKQINFFYKRFGRLKNNSYLCKTIEIGNDLDTSLNFLQKIW